MFIALSRATLARTACLLLAAALTCGGTARAEGQEGAPAAVTTGRVSVHEATEAVPAASTVPAQVSAPAGKEHGPVPEPSLPAVRPERGPWGEALAGEAPDGMVDILEMEIDASLPAAPEAAPTAVPRAGAAGDALQEEAAPKDARGAQEDAGTQGKAAKKDPCAGLEGEALEKARLWPSVPSMTTSKFGEVRSFYQIMSDAPRRVRTHSGIDLRAHLGWPVLALRGGKVIQQGPRGAAGITVEILQDDGRSASYAHLKETLVQKGQRVERGARIGLVGCTGRTSGAHLHLSMKENGRFVDPTSHLNGLWELFDPPVEELRRPIEAQSCAGTIIRGAGPASAAQGGGNARVRGTRQYLRMRKALLDANQYKIPDIPTWESAQEKQAGRKEK